jgi:hypothetical protein
MGYVKFQFQIKKNVDRKMFGHAETMQDMKLLGLASPNIEQKISMSGDVKLCSLVDVCRQFGGANCLHLQGRKVSIISEKIVIFLVAAMITSNLTSQKRKEKKRKTFASLDISYRLTA